MNLSTREWRAGPSLPYGVARPVAAVIDDIAYVGGGYAKPDGVERYMDNMWTLDLNLNSNDHSE